MYKDDYATCEETYVTLRLYSETLSPKEITTYLGIKPSETLKKSRKNILIGKNIKHNAWFLTSKDIINSKDNRRHIDYLADIILPITEKLKILANQNVRMDIACLWESKNGQGGPTLSPQQLSKLAEIGIEFWFDIY